MPRMQAARPLSARRRLGAPTARMLAVAAWATVLAGAAQGQSLGLCERRVETSAGDYDLVLRFTARALKELAASGSRVALVSRSGTDMSRFGVRYTHAGLALRDNPEGPWAVRQLYYVCDESRPRLFDQGLAGFLEAGRATGTAYLSIVTLPTPRKDEQLSTRALDKPAALRLLGRRYSANAYAYALRYQNCNQWVAEMMAAAWDDDAGTGPYGRAQAQAWLRTQAYAPADLHINSHGVMFIGHWLPLVHVDDHPLEDLYGLHQRISLPQSLEPFLRQQDPGAQRVEMCLHDRKMVVHRGWTPLGTGCEPVSPDDDVVMLD